MSMASTESSSHEETRKKNGTGEEEEELKKKKKLKSIKISRSPSSKPRRRKSKSQPSFTVLLSSSSSSYSCSSSSWSSNQSSPISASYSVSSPNYMKPTTCSDARKENFQKLAGELSSKSVKSSKFKTRTEMKKFSSRTRDFESGLNPNVSMSPNRKSISPGLGFVLQRKPSLKPVRKLAKMGTFKSKITSMEKNLERATCSSAMKDSKFSGCVHLQPGENESEKIDSTKVCPYSYCSLHGHRHGNGTPLKRYVSMRRRVLKTQMSRKIDNQAGSRSNRKRGIRNSVMEIPKIEHSSAIDEVNQTQVRNNKYIKKWHLVYKNVLKEIVEKDENKVSFEGKDEEEQVHQISDSTLRIEAIKLVQEAFDQILLPEIQDDSPRPAKNLAETESNGVSEKKFIEDDSMSSMKESRISSMVGNKSSKWSNLKKIILLKRFVKALEKARNINRREPRYLSMEADPEAEKVHLKHMTLGKKNTEEWFLDFALRKVITNLEPVQKKRVTLLVEAFESVIPADSMDSPQAGKYRSRDGILFGKISNIKNMFDEEQGKEVIQRKQHSSVTLSKQNESPGKENSEEEISTGKLDDVNLHLNPYREIPVNGKVLKVSKEIISRLSIKLGSGNLGSVETDMEHSALIGSTRKESGDSDEEDRREFESRGEFNSPKDSDLVDGNNLANEIKLDHKKNTGLWFLIYKHMVSSVAENGETEPLDQDDLQADNGETSLEISAGGKVDENGGENKKDDQSIELHSTEAIRLVEEAIDQILLPEKDDEPIRAINADPDLRKGKEDEQISQTEESDGIKAENYVERTLESEKIMSKGMKNWNNLRRIMIMKRFIKAVEKVKKFNPRGPRFLPITADEEAEKVELRHQDTESRKNAEEWMLDHALQQAIAKLSPARKRKVALLVEAFETVGPNTGR